MKLYFYFLDTNEIRMEECEVDEKPKTYKPVGKMPSGYYYCNVKKEEIGRLTGYNGNVVILTEKDMEKVAKVFRNDMNYKISRERDRIISANASIGQYERMLSMIDEWEKN